MTPEDAIKLAESQQGLLNEYLNINTLLAFFIIIIETIFLAYLTNTIFIKRLREYMEKQFEKEMNKEVK